MHILWDFDGTLFNTYPAFIEAMDKLLSGKVDKKEIEQKLKVSFSYAAKEFHLSQQQITEFKAIETAISPKYKKPFPFVEEILKKARVNVIMTHKPFNEVKTILDYYKWNDYFSDIIAGDHGYPRKPNCKAYQYLHHKHHIDLVIGDRLLDILPGKELGIKTCLFQNNEQGADFYVDDYKRFFDVLNETWK
ncbi:HAD-IA family hydrolase [Metabacillus arenae]|uniref:HAD-IA family hydrolase n=1 Tax=Metabacillus arenae TaxID=2771434 RepID=A0A926RW43_9BACI|nr:HAD-IA family hydrolase [Metabacillus arenae]MBD1380388.1 HAD-IA family hydrolase [Metabacillus arenae]